MSDIIKEKFELAKDLWGAVKVFTIDILDLDCDLLHYTSSSTISYQNEVP